MYEPRFDTSRRRFKQRRAHSLTALVSLSPKWATLGWLTFVPLGVFRTPPRVVPRIFTYVKKALRYPKCKSRFWVNAQCAYLVTRKPLNVRMGKGKGAKVRRYSAGRGQAPIAALSSARGGLRRRLRRFMATRLGSPVSIVAPEGGGEAPLWVRQWRTQAALLKDRAREIKGLLKLIRRPLTKLFFARLFRLVWRRPRLKWRFRWPLLARRAGAWRGRRWRLGSGFRAIAPLWAGIASRAAGVRRRRRLKLRGAPTPGRLRRWLAQAPRPRWAPLRGLLSLRARALRAIADTLKAPHRPASPKPKLSPHSAPLGALQRLWDTLGVRLARLERRVGGGWEGAPLPNTRLLGELQGLAIALPSAALSFVGGGWRVDPLMGQGDREARGGGDVAARLVYHQRGAAILTRASIGPLLMVHVSLWPRSG